MNLAGIRIRSLGWTTVLAAMAAAAIFTSNAHASRARILSLGSGDGGLLLAPAGNGGSLFVEDRYNIFYNPSFIVDHRDWAIVESSNFPGDSAQGGFATSFITFAFGFYFNRVAEVHDGIGTAAANTRPFEFFLGGDMGVKWGLGLTLANYDTSGGSNDDITLKLGAQAGGFDPFVNWTVRGRRTAAPNVTDVLAGIRYHYGEWLPYAAYRRTNLGVPGNQLTNRAGLGIGRTARVAEGVDMNTSLSYWRDTAEARNIVPIELSLEARALEWLSLRGGLTYRLIDHAGGLSRNDATSARLGAGVHVGQATLDWVVGSGQPGENFNQQPQAFGLANGFFTAASLAYAF